jgi:hypothetical protein
MGEDRTVVVKQYRLLSRGHVESEAYDVKRSETVPVPWRCIGVYLAVVARGDLSLSLPPHPMMSSLTRLDSISRTEDLSMPQGVRNALMRLLQYRASRQRSSKLARKRGEGASAHIVRQTSRRVQVSDWLVIHDQKTGSTHTLAALA